MGMSESEIISKNIDITVRKMKFVMGTNKTKRYWHNDSPFVSTFWSALSTAFPEGERFFMDSGRFYKDDINDPILKEQLADFVRQEAHHTMQHKKLNSLMDDFGYDMKKYDGWFGGLLGKVRNKVSQRMQLSASMALEHFTANFAHQYLANEKFTEGVDAEIKALWSWHAIEEIEHKGVLFDIYNEIEGDYFTRVTTMPVAWFGILAITFVALYDMLKQDDRLLDFKDNIKGVAYILTFLAVGTPEFIRYFKPGFHPWDNDNKHLIEEWYAENSHFVVNQLKKIA